MSGRRNLLQDLDATGEGDRDAELPAPETLKKVAATAGFGYAPQAVEPVSSAAASAEIDLDLVDPADLARKRQKTGRTHQFTTRLKPQTVKFIMTISNGRNVPVAQVIEEMVEAYKRETKS